jgi:hypothetical protein
MSANVGRWSRQEKARCGGPLMGRSEQVVLREETPKEGGEKCLLGRGGCQVTRPPQALDNHIGAAARCPVHGEFQVRDVRLPLWL